MITKITEDNIALYKKLFEKATESISDELQGANITTIDQYFQKIESLVKEDESYYILPLDEPTLDINADTRIINIPTHFRNHGISVKGDVISEVLFFTVDRYYDSTDLAEQNIIIEWEAAPASNASGSTGFSTAILKNTKLLAKDNKLLFGWAISDSITQNAGTIKFAVRFYNQKDGELTFSLSTLPATAIISNSLDYVFEKDNETWNTVFKEEQDFDKILARLKNSPIENIDSEGLQAPIYVVKLEDLLDDGKATLDLNEGGTALLLVEGYVEQGSVGYEWSYKNLNGTENKITNDSLVYLETKDTTAKSNVDYYKKVTKEVQLENGETEIVDTGKYELAGLKEGDAIDNGTLPIYEKFSVYEISTEGGKSVTGTYSVKISNIVGFAKKESEEVSSVTIPGPGTLEVEEPEAAVILGEDGNATISIVAETSAEGDTINYNWFDSETEEIIGKAEGQEDSKRTISLGEEKEESFEKFVTVSVNASRNGDTTDSIEKQFRVTGPAKAPVSVNPVKTIDSVASGKINVNVNTEDMLSDSLVYAWYKESDYEGKDKTDDAPAIFEGEINPNPSDVTLISLDVTESAIYYCVVKNVVNGSVSEAVASEYITVTA